MSNKLQQENNHDSFDVNKIENNKENKYLIFETNQDIFAIEIKNITEIIEYSLPTKVTGLLPFVHGLLNLRGKIIPIIDFSLYLGQKNSVISKKTCMIIIEYRSKEQLTVTVGILVDNVLDVLEIMPDQLEKPLISGTKISFNFIKNMFIWDDQVVTILNIDNMFINCNVEKQ